LFVAKLLAFASKKEKQVYRAHRIIATNPKLFLKLGSKRLSKIPYPRELIRSRYAIFRVKKKKTRVLPYLPTTVVFPKQVRRKTQFIFDRLLREFRIDKFQALLAA
jgi:hypothetical protein